MIAPTITEIQINFSYLCVRNQETINTDVFMCMYASMYMYLQIQHYIGHFPQIIKNEGNGNDAISSSMSSSSEKSKQRNSLVYHSQHLVTPKVLNAYRRSKVYKENLIEIKYLVLLHFDNISLMINTIHFILRKILLGRQ